MLVEPDAGGIEAATERFEQTDLLIAAVDFQPQQNLLLTQQRGFGADSHQLGCQSEAITFLCQCKSALSSGDRFTPNRQLRIDRVDRGNLVGDVGIGLV